MARPIGVLKEYRDRIDAEDEHYPSVRRLTRDLANAAKTMSDDEARYLVDAYYISQDDRKRAHNQVRAMEDEPHQVVFWLAQQGQTLETQIRRTLDAYTDSKVAGCWMKSIYGVGPVIAAGMLAHIDITRSPSAGHIFSFAGIAGDGQKKWEKGERRPYNVSFRTLCWKTGQCFMKFAADPKCTYGHIYRKRKEYEVLRNNDGYNREVSAEILRTKRLGRDTDAFRHYSEGHLPPAHVDARARRYAVKIFLSHLHAVMTWVQYGRLPPNPYAISILGHTHFTAMPNHNLVPGLTAALVERGLIPAS